MNRVEPTMSNREIASFVGQLLAHPPGAAHSVQLVIDTGDDVHALFEVLLMTMTEMLKSWYPPPISISAINPFDLDRMTRYFASFGIQFTLDIEDADHNNRVINNRAYLSEARLENMRFRIYHNASIYSVHFSNLPIA
jgi:hypothetical protein